MGLVMNQETRYKILIVDDERDYTDTLREYLGYKRPNWTTATAYDGSHALELLQENSRFDAGVIDLRMPNMDGEELLTEMTERYPDICPIIVTAYGDIPKAVSLTKMGAYDFQTKPIDPDNLIATIEEGIASYKLSDLLQEILIMSDIEKIFDQIVEIGQLYFQLSGYCLAVIEKEDGQLVIKRGYPGPDKKQIIDSPIVDSSTRFVDEVLLSGRTLHIVGLQPSDNWGTLLPDAKCLLAVPLKVSEDNIQGILSIESAGKERFTARDLRFLRTLADHVAVALHNAESISIEKHNAEKKLMATVTHEIRNTLQPAITAHGFLETWPQKDRAEYERWLNIISGCLEEAHKRMGDLMRLGGVEHLEKDWIDVQSVIEDAKEMLDEDDFKQDLKIETSYALNCPSILGDARHLKGVFYNLIENAAEAIAAKGKPGKITIQTAVDLDISSVSIRFTDTGIGIQPEHQARIFEPYFTTQSGRKGFGLGLAYIKRVVEQHAGYITFETCPGKGTVFTVCLPIRQE